jgi:hypothetical protein
MTPSVQNYMKFEKNDLYSSLLSAGSTILKRLDGQFRERTIGKQKIPHLHRGGNMGAYAIRFRYFSIDYCLRLELRYGASLEDGNGELCLYHLLKFDYPAAEIDAVNVFLDADGKPTNRLPFDLNSHDIHYHGPVDSKVFTRDPVPGLISIRHLLPAILLSIQQGMTNRVVVPRHEDE